MKLAYFDCAFGAAGDMLLGALISAGLPLEAWLAELAKIDLPQNSFRVQVSDVVRCTIAAKKVEVQCLPSQTKAALHADETKPGVQTSSPLHAGETSAQASSHAHSVSRSHSHTDTMSSHAYSSAQHSHGHSDHSHDHSHEQDYLPPVEQGHERNLAEILQIIANSNISIRAKELASAIFTRLGEAEASVHGLPLDGVHFHEVGAIDAIVDIVGFAIAYDLLGIERSIVSPLPVGTGTVKTRHGLFPVPGPAVINLLAHSGIPVCASAFITHECLTPTGAAILSTVSSASGGMPSMKITSAGYGAGTLNPEEFPNVCRIVIGEATGQFTASAGSDNLAESNFASEMVAVLEASLDDLSPQLLAFAMERLFEKGALDVSVTAVVMKKGRSGHLLSVLCQPEDRVSMEELILTQTSTLGVRSFLCERLVTEREWREVTLGDGDKVRIKLAHDKHGNLVNAQPEYEDCATYATKYGVPLKEVLASALANFSRDQSAR